MTTDNYNESTARNSAKTKLAVETRSNTLYDGTYRAGKCYTKIKNGTKRAGARSEIAHVPRPCAIRTRQVKELLGLADLTFLF